MVSPARVRTHDRSGTLETFLENVLYFLSCAIDMTYYDIFMWKFVCLTAFGWWLTYLWSKKACFWGSKGQRVIKSSSTKPMA